MSRHVGSGESMLPGLEPPAKPGRVIGDDGRDYCPACGRVLRGTQPCRRCVNAGRAALSLLPEDRDDYRELGTCYHRDHCGVRAGEPCTAAPRVRR